MIYINNISVAYTADEVEYKWQEMGSTKIYDIIRQL